MDEKRSRDGKVYREVSFNNSMQRTARRAAADAELSAADAEAVRWRS
jgi:hypothetical protein